MKPYFLDMYTATKVYLPNLPSFGSLEIPVDNVSKDDSRDQVPALVSRFAPDMASSLPAALRLKKRTLTILMT